MNNKKRICFFVFIAILVAIVFVSCSDGTKETKGTIKVTVSDSTKTIAPELEELNISYHVIKGEYQDGQTTIEKKFSGSVCILDNLLLGDWIFYVEGYNQEDVLIAKSAEKEILVKVSSDNSTSFILDYVDTGSNGTFSITISWDETNLELSTILGEIKSGDSVVLTKEWDATTSEEPLAIWEGELPFGSYDVLITPRDTEGVVINTVSREAMNIHSGFESIGSVYIANLGQVATPVITPDTGWITVDTEIAITTATPGASIYYTTDGSEPNIDSNLYTAPFKANCAETIKAFAIKEGMQDSITEAVKYRYKDSIGITIVKPENPIGIKVKVKEASEYDVINTFKPFEVEILDINDNILDSSNMNVSYKWYLDGEIFKDDGSSEEAIKFSDYLYHTVTVIVKINGREVSDMLRAKLQYEGPAGGYVFYDCDADNTEEDPDGADNLLSTTCGWRYLEAAPADVRLVSGTPTVNTALSGYSSATNSFRFGYYRKSSSNANLYVNGTGTYNSSATSVAIGSGASNSEAMSEAYGEYTTDPESAFFSRNYYYPAKLVSELEYKGFDDWFLPSKGELEEMYESLGAAFDSSSNYWSSSEYSFDAGALWSFDCLNGSSVSKDRSEALRIRPVRMFK